MRNYWEVKAKANKVGELLLYGNISSESFWGDEVTPKTIDAELKALGELDVLNVYVNSGGGSVFAGVAIFNIIKRNKATVKNAYIDGLAASISSVIPMACDNIYIPSNAMMMIHMPMAGARGNAKELRKGADMLDKVCESIMAVYCEKTGKDEATILAMMEAETWMTAKDAIEMGFATEMQAEVKIAASVDGSYLNFGDVQVDTASFKNFKPEVLEMYRVAVEKPEPVANKTNEEPEKPDLSAQTAEFHKLKLKILGGQ